MTAILLENTLVIALVVILGAIVIYAFRSYSPLGVRMRQEQNRRNLLDEMVRTCPTHGVQPVQSLVRLDDGTVVCSLCFQKVIHADNELPR